MKLRKRRTIVIALGWVLADLGLMIALTPAAEPGKHITMSSIVAADKKEGKVSWHTYLDEKQVGQINQTFQKEFPFIKIEYTRLRPPHERLMLEMQAGNFPYDAMMVRPNLIAQHKQLGHFFDAVDWRGLFGIDPRMIHADGFGVSVV